MDRRQPDPKQALKTLLTRYQAAEEPRKTALGFIMKRVYEKQFGHLVEDRA